MSTLMVDSKTEPHGHTEKFKEQQAQIAKEAEEQRQERLKKEAKKTTTVTESIEAEPAKKPSTMSSKKAK